MGACKIKPHSPNVEAQLLFAPSILKRRVKQPITSQFGLRQRPKMSPDLITVSQEQAQLVGAILIEALSLAQLKDC